MTSGSVTEITWYGCHTVDGTYGVPRDHEGTPIPAATVANNQPIDFPPALFAVPFVKALASANSGVASVVVQG